ncbi:hypothetical protein [Nonomuraea sp. NPDC049480]|uniref:hypothetical protein n=1 Tax=Nonomuraea sp. NPDC049480 TaxID=3364353 RepID=UPI00379AED11
MPILKDSVRSQSHYHTSDGWIVSPSWAPQSVVATLIIAAPVTVRADLGVDPFDGADDSAGHPHQIGVGRVAGSPSQALPD